MNNKRLLENINSYDCHKSYSTLLRNKYYNYYINRSLSCIKLKWFKYGLGDIKRAKFSYMNYLEILKIRGTLLFSLYRYIESKQIFKQILIWSSNNFFVKQVKTLQILIQNPIWIFQTEVSIFPTLHKKKCMISVNFILEKLKRICNCTQKGWLETIGRVEAFFGSMVFLDLYWIKSKKHFEKALCYLKKCKTLEGDFLLTTFLDKLLICNLKLDKQINCSSLKSCIGHSEKILFRNPLRYAQTLELLSRIMLKKANIRTSIQMLQISLIICRKKICTVQVFSNYTNLNLN